MGQVKSKRAEAGLPSFEEEADEEALASALPGAARLCFAVGAEDAGARLDRFLAGQASLRETGLSRTRLKSLIESGCVLVDTAVVGDAGAKVRAGQTVDLSVPPLADPVPRGEDLPLEIHYEDDDLIVLNKPAGLVVHPAPGHATGTLVNALIGHCGERLSGIGGVRRPGIVHRLDKYTSGLLVVAKNDLAHQGLAELFADHGRSAPFTREYLAFVWGVPDRPSGTIVAPLARHKLDREKMMVTPDGREAITHWELCETLEGHNGQPAASLLRCALETGRTHQIRVHLAHHGHPLLGDSLYGAGFKTKATLLGPKAQAALASLGRQALHATSLGFTHPITGADLRFDSPLPKDLQKLHKALPKAR
jgi:23S rRNA pseudouridine1911/1915/1917 synthase